MSEIIIDLGVIIGLIMLMTIIILFWFTPLEEITIGLLVSILVGIYFLLPHKDND